MIQIVLLYMNGQAASASELMIKNQDFLLKNLKPVEVSESHLFTTFLLIKQQKWSEALSFITEKQSSIVDKQVQLEYQAECHANLGESEKAKELYAELIERNNSNKKYYIGYLGYEPTSTEESGIKLKEELATFLTKFPRLLFLRRFIISYSGNGDFFKQEIEGYAYQMLKKGIPSFVNDI